MPLQPRLDVVQVHGMSEATHREQTGCFPSHLRCLDRHSVQASGDGLAVHAGDSVVVLVVMVFPPDDQGMAARLLQSLPVAKSLANQNDQHVSRLCSEKMTMMVNVADSGTFER